MEINFDSAVIYATQMHSGTVRRSGVPYVLHPLEVAQIISTMTTDLEVIIAGVLHDIVDSTDGTLDEIRDRFGDRVAQLVETETGFKHHGKDSSMTWRARKEETIIKLKNASDIGVRMLWLGDKLSNMRALADAYREKGDGAWEYFGMEDPEALRWYYKSIAEQLEIDLNRTAAFKELILLINFVWPNTFAPGKDRYKKYREVSVEGCPVIGQGAKGTVYRYDDELIIKVYNGNNTYKDIERENELAKKAFVSGIPTAISFGIVKVGERYGSMFELLNSATVSQLIAQNPHQVKHYADLMADLAQTIHSTEGSTLRLDDYTPEVYNWIHGGIEHVDADLTAQVTALVDAMPKPGTMIHGDFHTGNVMMQNDEPLIIDMDRLSVCHPIVELCGVYMFYVAFGELDHSFSEKFMGFSYDTELAFYHEFMRRYLGTDDEARIQAVTDKAALLTYVRLVRRVYKKGNDLNEKQTIERDYYLQKIRELLKKVDSLDF